jgi:hypothetical protein
LSRSKFSCTKLDRSKLVGESIASAVLSKKASFFNFFKFEKSYSKKKWETVIIN